MKFTIKTLGCKLNQSEGLELAYKLKKRGLIQVENMSNADIIIINTCTVTKNADAKARKFLSRAKKKKAEKIIVTGCAVNNKQSKLKESANVELVSQENKRAISDKFSDTNKEGEIIVTARSRPFVKIQDGCDHKCSYCIVPYVRGKSRSISYSEVKQQLELLADQGYKEIILTGVDIGSYNYCGLSLENLVEKLLKINDRFRLRLSSIEPQSITEKFFSFFEKQSRVCSHIHLPLQSGSNKILKKMGRSYTVGDFAKIVDKLRNLRPNLALTTDIIVGFPGETPEDFEETFKYCRSLNFSKIHVFRYSKRPFTKAVNMSEQVEEEEKQRRANQFKALAIQLFSNFAQKQIGKTQEILIERREGNYLKGVSSNYLKVYLAENEKQGELVKVVITHFDGQYLFGKLINRE